jgi:hypothetical protein
MKKSFSILFVVALCASAIPASATSILGKPICKPGDPVVWENTSTKVYHLSGDKYYGNTKHGAYACQSDANGAGYHASGQKSAAGTTTGKKSKKSADAMSAAGAASPMPMASGMAMPMASASPMGKHKRKHSKSASAMTGAASPTPMASTAPTTKHRKHHKKGAMASPSPTAT